MYSYADQVQMLEDITVKEGQGININCPFCGGRKTLGIAVKDGKRLWHCFKISCGIKGAQSVGMSASAVRQKINGIQSGATKTLIKIPDMLSSPDHHPVALNYLRKNHCIDAYEQKLIKIMYDPADKRVLFFSNDGQGAVGRSMQGETPKWKQYGDIPYPVAVGKGDIAVVVEDVPSACSVSRLEGIVGCSILGTSLPDRYKKPLSKYRKVIVALDADASRKAIELKGRLEGRVNTTVVFLEDDLKYMSYDDIANLLHH